MVLDFILNMFLVVILVSLFNIVHYIFKIRKALKMHKDNANIQGISIINGEIKIIEKNEQLIGKKLEAEKEWVKDPICSQSLDKKDAYRVFKEGQEYFFCSWECREAFLKESAKKDDDI